MRADRTKNDLVKNRLLLDQIADKWTFLILGSFCTKQPARFNKIKRDVEGISQKTLTQCLRKLERNGILKREIIDTVPIGVEYSMTELGKTLETPLEAMMTWVESYSAEVTKAQKKFDLRKGTSKE